ncbi:MAG: hypothetical protein CRU72_02620 [Candidatus Accumulibacter phosphatis]|jgi:phasin family protein|nr:hypothetical protein [Candidatus Accumulibacter phosphatis]
MGRHQAETAETISAQGRPAQRQSRPYTATHNHSQLEANRQEDKEMADLSQQLSAWSKAVASMDMTTSSEQMLNMIAALKVPGVNMDALVASQRDNLEALNAANQAALEGMKAVGEWQAKLLQETMRELTAAIGKLSQSGSPQQLLAAESDLAKKAFATAVGQMQELTQIVIQANQQASAAIAKRIPESLGEIKDVLKLPEASGKA